jgi:hypothetical protein
MVAGVMETVHTKVSNCYQAFWLGEADEAPLIYPEAIAATRALGGLRRLWLKIDATPEEYLAWEEVMDRWLLPRSRDYGEITCYCRCSGYWGIPVHLLLGPFNGPASAQGATTTEAIGKDPHGEAPHEENDD